MIRVALSEILSLCAAEPNHLEALEIILREKADSRKMHWCSVKALMCANMTAGAAWLKDSVQSKSRWSYRSCKLHRCAFEHLFSRCACARVNERFQSQLCCCNTHTHWFPSRLPHACLAFLFIDGWQLEANTKCGFHCCCVIDILLLVSGFLFSPANVIRKPVLSFSPQQRTTPGWGK